MVGIICIPLVLIKSAIVSVKGKSLDYGRQQRDVQFSADRLLLLEPLRQRCDRSICMLRMDRAAL